MFPRLPLVLLCGALACGSAQKAPAAPQIVAGLSLIPADTPYVMASLSRPPSSYSELQLESLQEKGPKALDALRALAKSLEEPDDEEVKFFGVATALLDELDGKMNEQGLRQLGVRHDPLYFVYGIGWSPIVRVELADGNIFRETVTRILKKGNIETPVHQYRGVPYWRIQVPGKERLEFAAAIAGNYLVGSVYPRKARTLVLRSMLGLETPKQSLADTTRLTDLAKRYGLAPWGIFSFHPAALGRELFGPQKDALAGYFGTDLSQTCRLERSRALSLIPDMVAGITSFEDRTLKGLFGFELREQTAKELELVRGHVPGAGTKATLKAEASLAIAIKPRAFADFIVARFREVGEKKFVCDDHTWINEAAESAEKMPLLLSMGHLQALSHATGLSVVLDRLGDEPGTFNPSGFVFLETDGETEPFLELLASTLGDKNIAEQKAGKPAIQLTGLSALISAGKVFLSIHDSTIAISLKKQNDTRLAKLADEKNVKPSFVSLHMNETAIRRFEELTDNDIAPKPVPNEKGFNDAMEKVKQLDRSQLQFLSVSVDVRENALLFDFVGQYPPK